MPLSALTHPRPSSLHLIHTQKRNPQTHLKDKDAFWSFFALNPESAHQLMILFSDRGITSFAKMNGYMGHTMKWVNDKGEWHYVQLHYLSDKGVKTFTNEEGQEMDGVNPDSGTQELFEMIDNGDYPTWCVGRTHRARSLLKLPSHPHRRVCIQTMTLEQARNFKYSVFDLTKVWSHKEFPLREIAKITLNKNPLNYFAEVEQAAFSPSHLVPGMEPSNDPVLQSRLLSYPDAHRYRLSVNYHALPVNCPVTGANAQGGGPTRNFHRDGVMAGISGNGYAAPNYPAPENPLKYKSRPYTLEQISEPAEDMKVMLGPLDHLSDLDFEQPRDLWDNVFDDAHRERYVQNVAGHLGGARPEVIRAVLDNIYQRIKPEIAERIEKAMDNPKVKSAKSATNGHYAFVPANPDEVKSKVQVNGHANGKANGQTNGH